MIPILIRTAAISLLAVFFMLYPLVVYGATYYIDYAAPDDSANGTSKKTPWKRCPGMPGFTGVYSHSPGDTFVFKGGVAWYYKVLPFTIMYSGSGDKIDVYTSDRTWFAGEVWTRPVFDGDREITGTNAIIIVNADHVKIDKLKLTNACKSGSGCSARTIEIKVPPDRVEISNCVLEPFAGHGIVASHDGSAGKSKLLIHHNYFSRMANDIELGCINCENAFDEVEIYNNKFYDMQSELVRGDHGDGIHIHNKGKYRKFTNVKVYNNSFYGNWGSGDSQTSCTAQVYFEDSVGSGAIFNNRFSYENKDTLRAAYIFSPGFVALYGSDNIDIYNNTFFSRITTSPKWAFSCIAIDEGLSSYRGKFNIKNNICSGPRFGILLKPGFTSLNIDYNLYHLPPEGTVGAIGSSFKPFLHWRALGYDHHGAIGDPLFANLAGKRCDLSLRDASSAKDAGVSLGQRYNSDMHGVKRPQGKAWDMGAFEHAVDLPFSEPPEFSD